MKVIIPIIIQDWCIKIYLNSSCGYQFQTSLAGVQLLIEGRTYNFEGAKWIGSLHLLWPSVWR